MYLLEHSNKKSTVFGNVYYTLSLPWETYCRGTTIIWFNAGLYFHVMHFLRKVLNQKPENRQYNSQKKKNKTQTMIYKTLHRKLKLDEQEPN